MAMNLIVAPGWRVDGLWLAEGLAALSLVGTAWTPPCTDDGVSLLQVSGKKAR